MKIEDFLKQNKTYNMFVKGSVNKAQEQISNNEVVLYAINSNVDIVNINENNFQNRNKITGGALRIKNKLAGVIVVTNKRIFFCNSVLGQTNMKEIRISDIQSIDSCMSILKMGELRVKGLTEMFVISIPNEEIIDNIKKALNDAKDKNENNSLNDHKISVADEIKKLKELCDSGIITHEEFETKKKQLLN